MPRATDTARQRELFRYYQPSDTPIDAAAKVVIHTSSDLSLTAFAQLGALRLNAKRGIISLVGKDTEYVIAEAGRTLSLQDDSRHDEGDALWHGVGAIHHKSAPGVVVMDLLAGITQQAVPHVILEDLEKDERFRDLHIVTAAPFARFLACFPLITPSGYVIGLYTIVDDKPRSINDAEVCFLQDMARTTMDHIESGRVKQQHSRAEKMVKALGLFLEGGNSLRNWWITQGSRGKSAQQGSMDENRRRGVTYSQQADGEFGVQDPPDRYSGGTILQDLRDQDALTSQPFVYGTGKSVPGDGRPPMPRTQSSQSTIPTTTTMLSTDPQTTLEQDSTTSEGPPVSMASTGQDLTRTTSGSDFQQTSMSGKRLQDALLSSELKRTFGRASNLIREATDVDGVAFFDASIGSFGSGSEKMNMNARAPGAHTIQGIVETTTSSSEEEKRRTSESDANNENGSPVPIENNVSILGFSTRSRSSFNKHSASEAHQNFPESLLRQLSKCYPHGKVFNFNEDGSMSSSDSEPHVQATTALEVVIDARKTRRKRKKKLSRDEEAAGVLSIVPGARTVAWFPLWDSALERWYAGTLIWSSSPMRVFCPEEDLTYMATFGNSIMAEVSRLSALVASQMKVDFISSISHELRSPLHGILASVEFLKDDSNLTDTNADMVNTINNCGNTLLQTIDHVLDFAKISKKGNEKHHRSRSTRHSSNQPTRRPRDTGNNKPIDIRSLTEQVIDSVYAGRRSWKPPASGNPRNAVPVPSTSPPIIVVDITWRDNWTFGIEDGAWRRILMNLFSNAVKYTRRGNVHIELHVELDEVPGKRKPYPHLCLKVSDSGQGISQEFLKNHIYTAFKQEDALSVGTGLGLSIVRQIILDLGGTIDITSELGVGTQASVSIPLVPTKSRKSESNEDIVNDVRSKVAGLKACLWNAAFNVLPEMSDATGILSPEAEALLLLKSSIRSTLRDWFQMDVVEASKLELSNANVHVTISSETLAEDIRAAEAECQSPESATVIVISSSLSHNPNYVTEKGLRVFFLQQPATPQKFASVLSHSLRPPSSSSQGVITPPAEFTLLHARKNEDQSTITKLQASPDRVPDTVSSVSSPSERSVFNLNGSLKFDLPLKPLHVLLVDDNEINLSLLMKCMSRLQHSFVTATNGIEAIEAYKVQFKKATDNASPAVNGTANIMEDNNNKEAFDAIFMDVQMPLMDGLTASREIRSLERDHSKKGKVAAIVALTGASTDRARQEAFAAGVDLFLVKPVSMKVIRGVMGELAELGRGGLGDWS